MTSFDDERIRALLQTELAEVTGEPIGVFEALYSERSPNFSLERIVELLEARPEIHRINAVHAGVNWYRHHLSELKTVGREATRTGGA